MYVYICVCACRFECSRSMAITQNSVDVLSLVASGLRLSLCSLLLCNLLEDGHGAAQPIRQTAGIFFEFPFLMDLFFEVIAIPIPFIFRIPSSFERPTALLSLCFFPTPSGATRQQLRLGDVSGVEPHPNYLAHTNSAVSMADSMPILIFRCRSD